MMLKKYICPFFLLLLWSGAAIAEDFGMFSAIKSDGAFTQDNLAGTWSIHALSMEGDDVLWITGDLVIDPSGAVAMTTGVDSENQPVDIPSGQLILDASGLISGTFFFEDADRSEFVVQDGKLDAAFSGGVQLNNYAVFIATCRDCDPDRDLLVYLTRSGFTGFNQVDAGGLWRLFATGFENGSNQLFWLFGSFRIDSSGTVVSGSFQIENSNGQQGFFSSGQVLLDENGRVTGVFEGTGSNDTTTFTGGQMTTDLNQITLVAADNQNQNLLSVLIYAGDNRGTGIFADTDIDGSWRYYGIRFDQPAGDADVSWELGGLSMENRGVIIGDTYRDRDGGGGLITGDRIELGVAGNLENGLIALDQILRSVDSGQMNIPPFPATSNPTSRFTFVGTDNTSSDGGPGGGGSGGGNFVLLPNFQPGDSSGCMISSTLPD